MGRHVVAELDRRGYRLYASDTAVGTDCRDAFAGWSGPEVDLFVHCAAVIPAIGERTANPLAVADNYGIDAAAALWVARCSPRRTVWLSSCAVYPVLCLQRPFTETDLARHALNPAGDYGWTKVIGERHALQLQQAGHKVHVFRPFSGYGADQSLNYPFPSIIDRVRTAKGTIPVWGAETIRDFVHIDDFVAAIFAALEADVAGPVNICTGIGTSMWDLNREVLQQLGHGSHWLQADATAPGGAASYRVGDPALLNTFYRPKITLEEGIWRALHR